MQIPAYKNNEASAQMKGGSVQTAFLCSRMKHLALMHRGIGGGIRPTEEPQHNGTGSAGRSCDVSIGCHLQVGCRVGMMS